MQRFVSPQLAEACVFPEPLRASRLAGQRVLFPCQQALYEALQKLGDCPQIVVKLTDISTADVKDSGEQLTRGCIACLSVNDNEFGVVTFKDDEGWGTPLI
jgi:hypothetical protein